MHRRVVSLWFPALPINRLIRKGVVEGAAPFAVVHEEKNALRLLSLTGAARDAGLAQGTALTDARAVVPDLLTRVHEPERDQALLRSLHRWAGKYSPWVALDGDDGLLLDVTGCAHLFGGEEEMLPAMAAELDRLQIEVKLSIADTKQAARALARFGTGQEIAETGHTRVVLDQYPVEALLVSAETHASLRRLGFKNIGDVMVPPRASLARRFGMGLVRCLDEMMGASSDPVCPATPRPVFAARMTFPDPIGLLDDVKEGVSRLARQLCQRLEKEQMGARQLKLYVRRADYTAHSELIGLARPSWDRQIILRQFERPLEKIDAGFGIEMLRLSVTMAEPVSYRQLSTRDEAHAQKDVLDDVLSRIGNRVGFDRIGQYAPCESHVPEYAFSLQPIIKGKPSGAWPQVRRRRPLIQFVPEPTEVITPGRPPAEFAWQRRSYTLHQVRGPERILPEWWRENPDWRSGPRDYWWVETQEGERLWLYNNPGGELPENWFVAGVFP